MADTDFVATEPMSRDPWILLDNLWSYLDDEDKQRLPTDLVDRMVQVSKRTTKNGLEFWSVDGRSFYQAEKNS